MEQRFSRFHVEMWGAIPIAYRRLDVTSHWFFAIV
jgi:hypothetical protein